MQQPHQEIVNLAGQLRTLDMECEFLGPDVQHNRVDAEELSASWHIDFGGLELKHSNIAQIKISEDGGRSVTPATSVMGASTFPTEERHFQYQTDCTTQIEPVFGITCTGEPMKKIPARVVDYHWEGDKLAQTLNQDHRLRKMLIEAKAPAIQVEGNHIRTQDEKFPSRSTHARSTPLPSKRLILPTLTAVSIEHLHVKVVLNNARVYAFHPHYETVF